MSTLTKNDALLYAYLDVSQIITSMDNSGELGCDVESLEATLDNIREAYDGTRPLEYFEEDEEAQMKDGGGYGVDAGSTLSKEINYGKKNKVGNLKLGNIPGA